MKKKYVVVFAGGVLVFITLFGLLRFLLNRQKATDRIIDQTIIGNGKEVLEKLNGKQNKQFVSTQYFSAANLGISFSFPASWPRPRINRQEEGAQVAFYNGTTVSLGNYEEAEDSAINVISIPQTNLDTTVSISYPPDTVEQEDIQQIIDSLEIVATPTTTIYSQPTVPIPTSTSVLPTPTLGYSPTSPAPDSPNLPQIGADCTYGCLSEEKFQ